MKNNRQVGLDGKVFLTSCLKRSSIYVIGVLLFGIVSAIADVLKLTGKSGIEMSSLTSTLVSIDLIVSLLFVVIVFYAYFLECGSSIPVLREKPIVILGYCRLAYNVLLCYYIVYRAMYCIVNSSDVPFGVLAFYVVYMVVAFLSILTCCFIINVISRNMIRRVYIRTLKTLSTVGIVFTALMSVMYIVARFWIGEIGDEYFTSAFCDLLRLCIAPMLYICVWIVLIKARTVTLEVFGEVDAAIKERRYQITYTDKTKETEEKSESKKLKNSKAKAASAAATVAAIAAESAQPALPEAKKIEQPKQAEARNGNPKQPEAKSENITKTEQIKQKNEGVSAREPAEAIYPQRVVTENSIKTRESKIKDEKLRKAVSEAVEKAIREENSAKTKAAHAQQPGNTPSAPPKMPVMDFDPYAQAEKSQNRVRQVQSNTGTNRRQVQRNPQQQRNSSQQGRPQQNRSGQQRPPQQSRQGQNPNQRKK